MVKHSNSLPDCPSCDLKLEQANPLFRPYFYSIRTKFPDCHISETFRDQQTQEDKFREGFSKEHWPNSKHNTIVNGKPESRAFDFFQQANGLYKHPPLWIQSVVDYCKSQNMPFRYGADFPTFKDTIHIELLDTIK